MICLSFFSDSSFNSRNLTLRLSISLLFFVLHSWTLLFILGGLSELSESTEFLFFLPFGESDPSDRRDPIDGVAEGVDSISDDVDVGDPIEVGEEEGCREYPFS